MIQLDGTYDNGSIVLDKAVKSNKPVKVVVTFMDEDVIVEKDYPLGNKFSFAKGQEILKNLKGNLSDDVIEERRSDL